MALIFEVVNIIGSIASIISLVIVLFDKRRKQKEKRTVCHYQTVRGFEN